MLKTCALYLVFCLQSLVCLEPYNIDFNALRSWSEQHELQASNSAPVNIKGFLYKTESGKQVLAAEPNLKSCCVGSKKKIDKQIFVSGVNVMKPVHSVVALQGDLHVSPTYDDDGELIALYYLKNAKILEDSNITLSMVFYGVMLLLATLLIWSIIRKTSAKT